MTTKIKATCECGQSLQAKPELAGKRVKCPACGEALVVPKPKVAAEKIRVTCQCGKTLSAKLELAGKRVKCPSCGNPLMVPKPVAPKKTPSPPTEQADDPLGLGDLEDLVQESAQAPQRLKRLPAKDRTAEDTEKAKPKKSRRTAGVGSLDGLTMVAGVACILHGLGGPAVMSRFVWVVVSTAGIGGVFNLLMSFQGFVAVASVVVGIGFIACGVGFLTRQPWAGQLAYTLALTYVGLLALGVVGQLVFALPHARGNAIGYLLLGAVKRSVPQLIVPGFIIYLAKRD